jgi:hypothetical protein
MATLLRDHDGFGVAGFTAGDARSLTLGVIRFPVVELPGHAHVTGKKTHGIRKKLAMACRILHNPTT